MMMNLGMQDDGKTLTQALAQGCQGESTSPFSRFYWRRSVSFYGVHEYRVKRNSVPPVSLPLHIRQAPSYFLSSKSFLQS